MPVIRPFTPRDLGPKTWGRELLVAEGPGYIAKVMWMKAGHGGAYQYHRVKDEAFYLLDGEAIVSWENADGERESVIAKPGAAYHIPPGAKHQVTAVTDCIIVEGSTPVFEDRVKAE